MTVSGPFGELTIKANNDEKFGFIVHPYVIFFKESHNLTEVLNLHLHWRVFDHDKTRKGKNYSNTSRYCRNNK